MNNLRKKALDEIYYGHYKSLLVMEANIISLGKLDPKMVIGIKESGIQGMPPVQFVASEALKIEKEKFKGMERVLKIIGEMKDEEGRENSGQ